MQCPICQKQNLKKALFHNVEVDYCPKCLGLWFDEEELRQAKDDADKNLNWLDIDLWQDRTRFKVSKSQKACPKDGVPLYEVKYGESEINPHTKWGQSAEGAQNDEVSPHYGVGVKLDICGLCRGIWLDRGEFKKIMDYLKRKGQDEILHNYLNALVEELSEVFTGPEGFKSELMDFLTVLKLLNYKFLVQHPLIAKAIAMLPK